MIRPLLLAAGDSRRMGRPKALLDFGGRPALALALAAVAGLGRPVVVLGRDADAIRAGVDLSAADVVINPDPGRGRGSSLKLALSRIGDEPFLVLPADHPLVTRDLVTRVVSARAPIVLPSHAGRRGHPVLFDAALKAEVLALGDDEPLRAVLHRDPSRIHHVEAGDDSIRMDMDTPEDYLRCLEAWRKRA